MEKYIHINTTFQEEYKKLDKLCKECFSSIDGVSEYIRQMENEPYSLQKSVISWEYTYNMLKHVRWIRNQLSHEVGTLNSDICTQEDLNFVINFYNEILNCEDSLTQMRILKERERKTQNRQYTTSISKLSKQNKPIINETRTAITQTNDKPTKQNEPAINSNKKSVFFKLVEKIKKIFS